MSTLLHTDLLAHLFRSHGLETVVTLRLADRSPASLTLWPYAVDHDAQRRNQRPAPAPSAGGLPAAYFPHRTHVLVLPACLEAYDQARQRVLDHPLLSSADPETRVSIEPLTAADMAALFAASRADFGLALAVVIG